MLIYAQSIGFANLFQNVKNTVSAVYLQGCIQDQSNHDNQEILNTRFNDTRRSGIPYFVTAIGLSGRILSKNLNSLKNLHFNLDMTTIWNLVILYKTFID